MSKIPYWKRAVQRAFEHRRREPRRTNFDQACALSALAIDNLRSYLAGNDHPTPEELKRRISLYRIRREQLERRLAATWKQLMVDP